MGDASKELEKILGSIGEASRFESVGEIPTVLPGLEIKGLGAVGVPFTGADAKRIIARASQAPYGRGEATIIDTDVRRVWQLEPSQFTLRNAAWNAAIENVVEAVKNDLGIQGKMKAELYKLLVYEKGSFFKPHRDTEKVRGMFATMVVCLPSRHEGGMLILEHDGTTKQIDFGGKDSEFRTRYAAFYADCRHEVTPVKSGYRVCLVYNLASMGKKQPEIPHHAEAVSEVARCLKALFSDGASPLDKMAIPLNHQYTDANFGPDQLKGGDRALANILIRAAESLDYQSYFALMTLRQSGVPEYDSIYYGRRGRSSRWDDDENEDEDEDGEFEEIFDEELKLEHWQNAEGEKQSFGKIHFRSEDILGLEDKEGWHYTQQVSEATGNEGASMDRWYRLGTVVIWPRENFYRVLATEGPSAAVPALEKFIAHNKTKADKDKIHQIASAILANWKGDRYDHEADPARYAGRMARILARIGDKELAKQFIREVFRISFKGTEGRALLKLCESIGWKELTPDLRFFLLHQKSETWATRPSQVVTIFEHLCCDPPELTKDRRSACAELAEELMQNLDVWDQRKLAQWEKREIKNLKLPALGHDDSTMDDKDVNESQELKRLESLGKTRIGVVKGMIRLLSNVGAEKLLSSFMAKILTGSEHYELRTVLVRDVMAIYARPITTAAGRLSASKLLQHCISQLRSATAEPVEPPTDWSREAKLGCSCKDCKALAEFLRDPDQPVARFPLAQRRRQHLHQRIEEHECDVTHITHRQGSPQTLVCTKTNNSFDKRKEQYESALKWLAALETLGSKRK